MIENPENPPAFPNTETEFQFRAPGMTLRDYFAAHIIAGMQANISTNQWNVEKFAKRAYLQADYMLIERGSL